MKLLCLILSFFVLTLSARPCCADRKCETEQNRPGEKSRHKEKECAACSPFYSCGSCLSFILTAQIIYNGTVNKELSKRIYPPYGQPQPTDVSPAIWQPPQLS